MPKKKTRKTSAATDICSIPIIPKQRARGKPIFVVQEHHASHLHWDFRLELDGVLKSWAVPKEPSMDSFVKRLAIKTEDHAMAYANFEGVIEEGHYGAGKVTLWDKGTFLLEERKTAKIIFHLSGKKLKGRFSLIKFERAGPKSWLLFKMKD